MTLVRNPFDAGGYSLAEMTQAINILPNLYTRLAQIGLFVMLGMLARPSGIVEEIPRAIVVGLVLLLVAVAAVLAVRGGVVGRGGDAEGVGDHGEPGAVVEDRLDLHLPHDLHHAGQHVVDAEDAAAALDRRRQPAQRAGQSGTQAPLPGCDGAPHPVPPHPVQLRTVVHVRHAGVDCCRRRIRRQVPMLSVFAHIPSTHEPRRGFQ
mgnify:CR=1 FL=1